MAKPLKNILTLTNTPTNRREIKMSKMVIVDTKDMSNEEIDKMIEELKAKKKAPPPPPFVLNKEQLALLKAINKTLDPVANWDYANIDKNETTPDDLLDELYNDLISLDAHLKEQISECENEVDYHKEEILTGKELIKDHTKYLAEKTKELEQLRLKSGLKQAKELVAQLKSTLKLPKAKKATKKKK